MSDVTSQVQSDLPPLRRPASGVTLAPTSAPTRAPTAPRPRVWPAAVIVALEWLAIETPRWLELQFFVQFMFMFLAPIVAAVLLVVWWLFFSRLPWRDRCLGLGVVVPAAVVSALLVPYPVMSFLMTALPWITTVWAVTMLVTLFLPWPIRAAGLLAAFAPLRLRLVSTTTQIKRSTNTWIV